MCERFRECIAVHSCVVGFGSSAATTELGSPRPYSRFVLRIGVWRGAKPPFVLSIPHDWGSGG